VKWDTFLSNNLTQKLSIPNFHLESGTMPETTPAKESNFSLRRSIQRVVDFMEPAIVGLIHLCGWSAIIFVMAIFFFVFKESLPAMTGIEEIGGGVDAEVEKLDLVEFATSPKWIPESAKKPTFGILALMLGTLSVTILSMVIAVPLGLGAAVYVSEFAKGKSREILKVLIELLAAIPSVVWGFIGLVVMNPMIVDVTGEPVGLNILNAGIVLALMSVPIIVSVSEDALRAVPDSFREAGIALGANRWEMVYKVLFPAAKNGLLAAVLLGIGRGIGETMAVLMCTGHSVNMPTSLFDPVRTLTATIAAELGEAVRGDMHYHTLFLIGVVLFVFAFVINLTADLIVKGIKVQGNE
jgi:phosphate transport system permease protein